MGRTILVRVGTGGIVRGELTPLTVLGVSPQLMEGTWLLSHEPRERNGNGSNGDSSAKWSATVVASVPEAQDIPEVTWTKMYWD